MPSTVFSLVLAGALLVPGLAYTLSAERESPNHKTSGFRETAVIAVVSACADSVVLAVFALIRLSAPSLTPDTGKLIRTPAEYARASYSALILWFVFLLALATLLAHKAAQKKSLIRRGGEHIASALRLTQTARTEVYASAWWSLFREHQDGSTYVGCHLDDGTYIAGTLRSYSRDTAETGDRELTLAGELTYRPPGGRQDHVLENVGGVVIRAQNIRLMNVTHIRPQQPAPAIAD